MTVAYGIMAVIAVVLWIGYLTLVRQKQLWFMLLFGCVSVVNIGYFLLSLSQTVEFALFANKIAYLGSAFLPLCMWVIVAKLCGFSPSKRWLTVLGCLGAAMFLLVCTTGYLPWYYRDVSLVFVDGAAKLVKEYGVLHPLYLVYTLGYFTAMIATVITALKRHTVASVKHAALIVCIVFGNIAFWLVEKVVSWDFEFLSVSYLFSETILLGLYWMMQDYVLVTTTIEEKLETVLGRLPDGVTLHPREREVLVAILAGRKRKEIADDLCLSENTVKTYTRNLYRKLGVTGREELYDILK